MKRMGKIRAILLTCALFITPLTVSALPSAGTWSATTITGVETVTLTGDVTVSGTIIIENGGKLTINNNTGSPIHITPTTTMDNIFRVRVGGELVINGNASGSSTINYDGIIIDGKAELTWNDYNLDGSTSLIRQAIHSSGNFDIKNVTIQNIYRPLDSNGDCSCNGIFSDNGDRASISNCEFRYIKGISGSAVLCTNANSAGSTLDISDSHFIYCVSNNTLGSTIRSHGYSTTTLTMKNTCVENCSSDGHGGAVYWNAHGRTETCCKFDGCQFLNNRSKRLGGALFIETSIYFYRQQNND